MAARRRAADGALAGRRGAAPTGAPASGAGARVLVADDNADMRQYVARLLRGRWDVEAVGDGHAALAAIRARAGPTWC